MFNRICGSVSGAHHGASRKRLHVILASPLGRDGKGGMDRIASLVVSQVEARPEWGVDISYLTTKGGISKLLGAFVFVGCVLRLLIMGLMGRGDVLHINLAAFGSVHRKAILASIARILKIPYIVHVHSGRFGDFWNGASRRMAAKVDRLLSRSSHIIVLGRGYRELVLSHLPDGADKLTVLANATPARVSVPRAPGEVKQITYLGLIADKKGVRELIAALDKLAGRSDWTATLAGHGDVEAARQAVKVLGLQSRVSIPGWIGPDEVDGLLRRTDIFVLPSYSEGLSMAVLEAFASGNAVIATPVNAMTEVIEDGRNGLLVPPGDVEALREAVQRLLDDDALRMRLASAALADHAERYDIEPYVNAIVGIWQSVASGAASRRKPARVLWLASANLTHARRLLLRGRSWLGSPLRWLRNFGR